MKFKVEIPIRADLETVWQAFDDPDNMTRWQTTLKSFTHQSGSAGQPGAISELVYDENGKEVRIRETITERREPHFMAAVYDSKYSKALVINHFKPIDDGTLWSMHSNHQFKGIMKLLSIFIAGSVKNRIAEDMNRFKLMLETDLAGASS